MHGETDRLGTDADRLRAGAKPVDARSEAHGSGDIGAGDVADVRAAVGLQFGLLPRLESVLLGIFSVFWALAFLVSIGVLPRSGPFDLDLYSLYGFGATLGWLAGNVYVLRGRRLFGGLGGKRPGRKRLLMVYFFGPPALLYVLRALAPQEVQLAAPFVPLYSFLVFAIFFAVPVTLRVRTPRR